MKKTLQRVYIGMDSDGSYYAIPYRRREEFLNDQATGDDSFYQKWDPFICDLWKLELYTMVEEDPNQEETDENESPEESPESCKCGCGCMEQDICPYQKDVNNQTSYCTCCDFRSD